MRITDLERVNLDGIDMTNVDTFMDSLRRIPRDRVVALNSAMLAKREEFMNQFTGLTTLYHGAPENGLGADNKLINIHQEIMANGFQLTRGRRGGAFGSNYFVENLGIFLSDQKNLAQFFANNRDERGYGKVIECKVDTTRLLDSGMAKGDLVKLGVTLLNKYNGTSKTKLAMKDWWWLVDQPAFVNRIKQDDHTGVKFKENASVRRSANAFDGHTFFIFDPSSIHIKTGYSITMFYEDLKKGLI